MSLSSTSETLHRLASMGAPVMAFADGPRPGTVDLLSADGCAVATIPAREIPALQAHGIRRRALARAAAPGARPRGRASAGHGARKRPLRRKASVRASDALAFARLPR